MIKVAVPIPNKTVAFLRGMLAALHSRVEEQLRDWVGPKLLDHEHVFRRSHRNGGWDQFMSWLGWYPWRCTKCGKRNHMHRRM